MRSTLTHVLCLAAALAAGPAEAKSVIAPAAPVVVPAPQTAAPAAAAAAPALQLRVTLKDGQQADVTLRQYDSVFLSVTNARGSAFDLPWVEVAAISGEGLGADQALMQGHITGEASPVGSRIAAKEPGKALRQALWPGLLLHGAGHRYAGDQDTFFSLAGAELFGLVIGGFGASELAGPGRGGETKDTALALTVGGGAIFALTWLWDLGFAPGAARKFNQDHSLALEPLPYGAQLAFRF